MLKGRVDKKSKASERSVSFKIHGSKRWNDKWDAPKIHCCSEFDPSRTRSIVQLTLVQITHFEEETCSSMPSLATVAINALQLLVFLFRLYSVAHISSLTDDQHKREGNISIYTNLLSN